MLQNLCITHVMLLPASDVQRSEHKQLELRLIVFIVSSIQACWQLHTTLLVLCVSQILT